MPDDELDAYISRAPHEQQPALRDLRAMIEHAIPHAQGEIGPNQFAVYSVDGAWVAGFATRKKCPMLYVMVPGVLDSFEDELGGLRSGRSCIDYRAAKSISEESLRSVCGRVLDAAGEAVRD